MNALIYLIQEQGDLERFSMENQELQNNKEKHQKKHIHLVEANKISASTGKNMIVRVLTALVLLFICLPLSFVGSWGFFILILVLAFISILEVSRAPKEKNIPIVLYITFIIITLSFIYWYFIKNALNQYVYGDGNSIIADLNFNFALFGVGFANSSGGIVDGLGISIIMVAFSFLIYFTACITNENFTFKDVCYFFTMSILIGIGFQSMYYVKYLPFSSEFIGSSIPYYDNGYGTYALSTLLFIFVLIGCMMSDIGAYFVGVLFGKHKINERISPKKTWEGFVGGILIATGLALVFAFSCSAGGCDLLPGVLDFEHWYNVVILAVGMPFIANIGDFAFSAIKRNFGIKDFGNIIPGHGGVLDRLDSVLFTFIFVACLLTLMSNGWWFLN